jgi:site-specific DNA-methyltransferase (adenine-specific)
MIRLLLGDCAQILPKLQANTYDSLITDPPAGISFMGQAWDGDRGGRGEWCAWLTGIMREALRVLKPGAHGLVWAIPRRSHWTALALEDAGFEIRDCLHPYFLSGFPKSLNVGKAITAKVKTGGSSPRDLRKTRLGKNYQPTGQVDHRKGRMFSSELDSDNRTTDLVSEAKEWDGWGTGLKPAIEHWWLVRKPLSERTVAENVLKWGTGALNIDASRIPVHRPKGNPKEAAGEWETSYKPKSQTGCDDHYDCGEETIWRERIEDKVEGKARPADNHPDSRYPSHFIVSDPTLLGDHAGFFYPPIYCPKARKCKGDGNDHPTVKPVELMKYFITLLTRPRGHVLDCFAGSFTTGVAAQQLGFRCTGIEMNPAYVKIGIRRLGGAA